MACSVALLTSSLSVCRLLLGRDLSSACRRMLCRNFVSWEVPHLVTKTGWVGKQHISHDVSTQSPHWRPQLGRELHADRLCQAGADPGIAAGDFAMSPRNVCVAAARGLTSCSSHAGSTTKYTRATARLISSHGLSHSAASQSRIPWVCYTA